MIVYYPPNHHLHDNLFELDNGILSPSAEKPERVEVILKTLRNTGSFIIKKSKSCPISLLKQVHTLDYLNFLKTPIISRLEYPSVIDYSQNNNPSNNYLAQKGRFLFDFYTPITRYIWQVARESAGCAYEGSELLLAGEHEVYALCRPPGHHAMKSCAGGYCYLNNLGLAAQNFLNKGAKKIAILDIDFHHANGTQEIFYRSSQVLTISIHADPQRKFPYFSGFKNEHGEGKGKGFNYNFPLKAGITINQYLQILSQALGIIKKFHPKFLLVAAGFDTYEKDPICDFKISLKGFFQIGQQIANLSLPTLLVQEGGYYVADLGKCVVNLLAPFISRGKNFKRRL